MKLKHPGNSVTDLHVFENNIYSCKIHVVKYLLLIQFFFHISTLPWKNFSLYQLKKKIIVLLYRTFKYKSGIPNLF